MPRRTILFCIFLTVLLAACRSNEPVPTLAVLRILNFWQPVSDRLSAPGATHIWQFVAEAGDAIHVRVSGDGMTLALKDPGGAVLAQGAEVRAALSAGGIYTLVVGGPPGSYTLTLEYTNRPNPSEVSPTDHPLRTATPSRTPRPTATFTPTPTPTPFYLDLGQVMGTLSGGELNEAVISHPNDKHVYLFDGQNGQIVSLLVSPLSGDIDPFISLYDPAGAALAVDDNSGGGQSALLRNIHLPSDGAYSIVVSSGGRSGRYQIRLDVGSQTVIPTIVSQPTPTPLDEILTPTIGAAVSGNRLEDHTPVSGAIARPGDFDRYPVDVAAGQALTIGAYPAEGSVFQPHVEVYDPDGLLVGAADEDASGQGLIPALLVSQNGTYNVYVSGMGDSVGAYVVGFGSGPSYEDVRRGAAEPDQLYTVAMSRQGLREVWSLYLTAGDVISAAVSPLNSTLDPYLEMVAPDGSVISADDNSGGGRSAFIARSTAGVTGLYHLWVTAVNAASNGPYTIVWRYVNAAPTATLPPPSVLLMSVNGVMPPQQYLYYPFQGRAGQHVQISITAQPGGDLDAVAALFDPNGRQIASGDDENGLNPQFDAILPADGTYTVRINGYGLSQGPFTLIVQAIF